FLVPKERVFPPVEGGPLTVVPADGAAAPYLRGYDLGLAGQHVHVVRLFAQKRHADVVIADVPVLPGLDIGRVLLALLERESDADVPRHEAWVDDSESLVANRDALAREAA